MINFDPTHTICLVNGKIVGFEKAVCSQPNVNEPYHLDLTLTNTEYTDSDLKNGIIESAVIFPLHITFLTTKGAVLFHINSLVIQQSGIIESIDDERELEYLKLAVFKFNHEFFSEELN